MVSVTSVGVPPDAGLAESLDSKAEPAWRTLRVNRTGESNGTDPPMLSPQKTRPSLRKPAATEAAGWTSGC